MTPALSPQGPHTEAELEEAGYEFEDTGRCRWCGIELAWYRAPHRAGNVEARVPFEEGTLIRHRCSKRV